MPIPFKLRYISLLLPMACSLAAGAEPPRGSITIDRISALKHPTNPTWSPDGKMVAFLWDAAGKQDLFVVKPGEKPIAMTDAPVDPEMLTSNIGQFEWAAPDQLLFARAGGLWTVNPATVKASRLPGFEGVSSFSLSGDRKLIAFVRRGQVWVGNLKERTEKQLTRFDSDIRVTAPSFSPDQMYVSFNVSRGGTTPEPMPYNGDRMFVVRNVTYDQRTGIVGVYSGDPVMIPTSGGGGGGGAAANADVQWVEGPALLRQEYSQDRKTRWIQVTTPSGETRTLWKDFDPAWISLANGPRTVASPDGKMVAFISDRSGWAHLYVIPANAKSESEARQLSKGNFGDGFPSWSPDSKQIVYTHSAAGNQMERFLSVVDAATGKITPLVTARGVNFDPAFSPDGSMVAYSRSAVEHPLEIYTVAAKAGSTPVRLTDSLAPGLAPSDFTAPTPVYYPSRAADKKQVPATLMAHKNLDRNVKHPAIIWIHGSGADQNYLGWHPGAYRMYYSMHQYLAQQGYVILTPDYRGSSGYSREWTTGAFRDLGGGETQDVNAGADYLKTLSYVDPDRIGVWGLSYGGFMTLQSIITAPQLFKCAIDVAGVGDWATWITGGTLLGRMGGTTVTDPELYEKSAPARHLDKIVDPLMILQGTNDTNVGLWETMKVVDRLLKHGKSFEMAFYPGEIHFFRREHVLRDAWRRSEEFFDKHLKTPAPHSTSGGGQ